MKSSSEIFMLLQEVQDIADNMEANSAPSWFWDEIAKIEDAQDLSRESALKYLILCFQSYSISES
jgi:hypothetical protein